MQQLLRGAPYFPVSDVAAAVRHYVDVLGFQCEYIAGDPSEFAIVSRDGLPIMLRLVPDSSAIVPNERQGGTWDVFFWVSDAGALYGELLAAGADVVYGPLQTTYGTTELAARDRDGYVLGFGQELPAAG